MSRRKTDGKKNTLRYILLGLLSKKKMTGYELNQSFKNEIGEFWQAKHSQIYPELAKMEEQGIIQHQVEITGEKLEKKVYELTEEGRNNWQSGFIHQPMNYRLIETNLF